MAVIQRCTFIEGIGRVHSLTSGDYMECAPMDALAPRDQMRLGVEAADILSGVLPANGRIKWSVRFREHKAST